MLQHGANREWIAQPADGHASRALKESNPRKDQPPGDSAGKAEEEKELDSGPVALGMVTPPFRMGEPAFFGGAQGRPVGRGENVVALHLLAPLFCRSLFREERLEGSDPGIQLNGLLTEIIDLLLRAGLFFGRIEERGGVLR